MFFPALLAANVGETVQAIVAGDRVRVVGGRRSTLDVAGHRFIG